MKKIKLAFVGFAAMLGTLGWASNVNALTSTDICTSGIYFARNYLDYELSGSTWMIRYIGYLYTPSNSVSTHNNLNERLYSSSNSLIYSYNSPDNLVRDGQLHWTHYFVNPLAFSVGQTLKLTNIFDVPNAADPQCTTSFYR
jgi:hypothetical protein